MLYSKNMKKFDEKLFKNPTAEYRATPFGAIHDTNFCEPWFGPIAWRTKGDAWSYEYRLKHIGILVSPKIKV